MRHAGTIVHRRAFVTRKIDAQVIYTHPGTGKIFQAVRTSFTASSSIRSKEWGRLVCDLALAVNDMTADGSKKKTHDIFPSEKHEILSFWDMVVGVDAINGSRANIVAKVVHG